MEAEKIELPNWFRINTEHIEDEQRTMDIYALRATLDAFGKANGFTRSEISIALSPRWLSESYPGMENDIAKDLHRNEFWKKFGEYYEKEEFTDAELDRAVAESYSDSTVHANTLKEGMDRVFTLMMWKIRKTGLYKLLTGEYESVSEWLNAKLDVGDISLGERSNVLYLLEEFLPALDNIGFDSESLLLIPEKWTAARAAIPHLRNITKLYRAELEMKEAELAKAEQKEQERIQKEIDGLSESFTDEIHHTFDVIESTGYREVPAKLRGESSPPKPRKVEGQLIKLPDESYWIVIPCPNEHYLSMIQKLVHSMVSKWEWRGPISIAQSVSEMLLNKDGDNG